MEVVSNEKKEMTTQRVEKEMVIWDLAGIPVHNTNEIAKALSEGYEPFSVCVVPMQVQDEKSFGSKLIKPNSQLQPLPMIYLKRPSGQKKVSIEEFVEIERP